MPQSFNARDVSPIIAVEIGYSLYLVDCCRKDSALWQSADAAVRHFNQLAAAFEGATPAGVYFLNLRLAANSLARGISRRKRTLQDRIAAAKEEKQNMVAQIAQTERAVGILKGGFQILAIGGFGYILMHMLLHSTAMQSEVQSTGQKGYASMAFALGVALIGSFFKAKLMTRRILGVFDQYNNKFTQANQEYVQEVIQEYRFAAETAELAWEQYTREKAPVTPGFESLLIGIMGGDQENIDANIKAEEEQEGHADARPGEELPRAQTASSTS